MMASGEIIELNSHLLIKLVDSSGGSEKREFTIVTSKQADFQSGLLDENTPLAQALLGHKPGDVIPYPRGDLQEIRVLKVELIQENVSPENAERRRAAVQKAAKQSEITNQMIFSTASGSKWGDYEVDIDKLLDDNEKGDE